MKRLLLSIMMMTAAVIGTAAQSAYYGQCISMQKSAGDSILLDLCICNGFTPKVKDGNVVWEFTFDTTRGMKSYLEENVTAINFRTEDEVRQTVTKALKEFYEAMDGDHWSNNTNWCSDKPFEEWFGLYTNSDKPYPQTISLQENNVCGHLPEGDCLVRLVGLSSMHLWGNHIGGELPPALEHIYAMNSIGMNSNQLTGEIPPKLFDQPFMQYFEVSKCNMTGEIPANFSNLMDAETNFNIDLSGNDFSGELPASIVNHKRFAQLWDYIVPQRGHLAVPDIPAPVMDVTDVNGNHFLTTDVYKDNILTLLYNYSSAKSSYTDKLAKAYEAYKSKGFEVLGMMPGNVESVMAYLHENNINWMNIDPEGFEGFYHRYFPYLNYVNLVDQDGHIVFTSIMDENGKMEDTGWNGSTRDQLLFDVLEKKFGTVDYTPYTSTDYSADGEVITLQKATKGLGVDLVFVGNAYTDKDMAPGGKYEMKMNEAMEQFFAYEPLTSLRDRFNVYAVKAVSPNQELYDGTQQAISNTDDAFNYARKVPELIPDRPLRVNVIYNSYNAGRSVTYMYDDASYVAFMLNGVNRVVNHEGGGHGVGRLLDEYVEDDINSKPSEEFKEYFETIWKDLGRGANIDLHADVTQTRWSHLAADSRYEAEKLGAYEGAGTFGKEVYRPTENSMMRYNDIPFNAPSREAIYKYVMQESEGPDWVYDYETFVAFDELGRQQYANALRVAAARGEDGQPSQTKLGEQVRPLPPVFVKGTPSACQQGTCR